MTNPTFTAHLVATLDTTASPPCVVDVRICSDSAQNLTTRLDSKYLYVDLFSCESATDFQSAVNKVRRALELPTSSRWAWVKPFLKAGR